MDRPVWTTCRSMADAQATPVTWLVDEYVPANTVTLLSSVSGSGKSILALHLTLHLLTGREWLGQPVRQAAVAYWDQDNPDRWLTDNRICAIGRGMGLATAPAAPIFRTTERVMGERTRIRELIVWLASQGITVLVVDTLASVNPYSESDATEMARAIVDNFFPMVEAGITPIVLHHIGKDFIDQKGNSRRRTGVHAARGSSAILAAVGAAFNVDRDGDDRRIVCVKPRYGSPPAIRLRYDEAEHMGSSDWKIIVESANSRVSLESLTHLIIANGWQNLSSRQLADKLRTSGQPCSQSTAARALSLSQRKYPI